MEDSTLVESESATASAPLKRQGDDSGAKIETKKRKMKVERGLPLSVLQHHIKSHNRSIKSDLENYLDDSDSDFWEFQPEEHYLYKQGVSYTVHRIKKGKCNWGWRCDYHCPLCKKCSHQFECDCEDGKGGNMCEHIHFVCGYLEKKKEKESNDDEDDEGSKKEDANTEAPEESDDEDETDDDETDQRTASFIVREVKALLKKAGGFITRKRNADIIKQSLLSIIPLLKEDNSQK